MKEYLEKLKNQYGYDEELLNLLDKIIPKMIEYYGEENKDRIITSLLNTPIIMINDDKDGQEFYDSVGIKEKFHLNSIANAMHDCKFVIGDDNSIKSISYIVLRHTEFSDIKNINLIVHELCHMVMSQDSIHLDNDIIVVKSGLYEERFQVNGNVINMISSTPETFEEALIEYESRMIVELITGEPVLDGNYNWLISYVSIFMNNENARRIIARSRINGDDSWKSVLGEELSDSYMNLLNEYFALFRRISLPKEERKRQQEVVKEKLLQDASRIIEVMKEFEVSNGNLLK